MISISGMFALLFGLVSIALYVYSLVWVYRDAEARDTNPLLVTLLVALISWPLGLLVWLLVRPDEYDLYDGVLDPGDDPLL
ncbi:MAG: hypothetical protein Rubg2KO_07710 [Rubricoccaceae bacterium]